MRSRLVVWVLAAGVLLVGAAAVLVVLAGGESAWTRFVLDEDRPPFAPSSMAVAGDGSVWATTGLSGVARFDGSAWETWTTEDGLAADMVPAVAVGDDGAVWAGTRKGVSRFGGQPWWLW